MSGSITMNCCYHRGKHGKLSLYHDIIKAVDTTIDRLLVDDCLSDTAYQFFLVGLTQTQKVSVKTRPKPRKKATSHRHASYIIIYTRSAIVRMYAENTNLDCYIISNLLIFHVYIIPRR